VRSTVLLGIVSYCVACASSPHRAPQRSAAPMPVDTTAGLGAVARAVAAIDALDWAALEAELDTSDFTFSFLPIAHGRPMTDWPEVAGSIRAYFDSVRAVRPRLGIRLASLRASDSSFVRIVYANIADGPIPGWWSFLVARKQDGSWRINLLYAVGEPEPTRFRMIPLRLPSNGQLELSALTTALR
jgi:hypothetical protein